MNMQNSKRSYREFRKQLIGRENVLGTFIKTPTSHATEIMGILGFDFVVFDQEHAAIGQNSLDMMILGARASNIASIVRVGDSSDHNILSVLDCGATGILVPHVATAKKARSIVAACRYKNGHRGYANTTRAGQFGGIPTAEHIKNQDAEITCIAMIEDVSALDEIDEIVQTDGLDAIFIGRGDLTAAIGAPSMTSAETHEIVAPIMAAAKKADLPIIMLSPTRNDAEAMAKLGASAFIISSDHGFMRKAATAALNEFKSPIG